MICNATSNAIMNSLFSGTKWIALMNTDPTQEGSLLNEMQGAGYVRKAMTFTTAAGRSVENTDVIWWADLPDAPIRYIAVCDSEHTGTMIAYQATGSDIYVESGKRFVIAAGDLAFTLN
jgi:hypothetical protein